MTEKVCEFLLVIGLVLVLVVAVGAIAAPRFAFPVLFVGAGCIVFAMIADDRRRQP